MATVEKWRVLVFGTKRTDSSEKTPSWQAYLIILISLHLSLLNFPPGCSIGTSLGFMKWFDIARNSSPIARFPPNLPRGLPQPHYGLQYDNKQRLLAVLCLTMLYLLSRSCRTCPRARADAERRRKHKTRRGAAAFKLPFFSRPDRYGRIPRPGWLLGVPVCCVPILLSTLCTLCVLRVFSSVDACRSNSFGQLGISLALWAKSDRSWVGSPSFPRQRPRHGFAFCTCVKGLSFDLDVASRTFPQATRRLAAVYQCKECTRALPGIIGAGRHEYIDCVFISLKNTIEDTTAAKNISRQGSVVFQQLPMRKAKER